MTKDNKDRFGEKLKDAERGKEHQYFAEREKELLAKLRRASEGEEKAAPKEAEEMRCPKCDVHLRRRTINEIDAAECPDCHGMWLEHGAQKRISQSETEGWIARWLRTEFPEHS
jgi:predicted Zn-ribbon and HTH transcriptional regulator